MQRIVAIVQHSSLYEEMKYNESGLFRGTIDVDPELPDLLAQRVAVDAQQVGRLDLVAASSRDRGENLRVIDLVQNALIKTGRRHLAAERDNIALLIVLYCLPYR